MPAEVEILDDGTVIAKGYLYKVSWTLTNPIRKAEYDVLSDAQKKESGLQKNGTIEFTIRLIGPGLNVELDDYLNSKNTLLDAVDFFMELYQKYKEKNDSLALAEISQIIKNLYQNLENNEQYIYFSKREAGSYINLAENLQKVEKNYF